MVIPRQFCAKLKLFKKHPSFFANFNENLYSRTSEYVISADYKGFFCNSNVQLNSSLQGTVVLSTNE